MPGGAVVVVLVAVVVVAVVLVAVVVVAVAAVAAAIEVAAAAAATTARWGGARRPTEDEAWRPWISRHRSTRRRQCHDVGLAGRPEIDELRVELDSDDGQSIERHDLAESILRHLGGSRDVVRRRLRPAAAERRAPNVVHAEGHG